MVEMDKAGARLQLQIHDECVMPVKDREEARQYASIMENCIPLRVPMRVDIEIGKSWGEAK
jgi:DNA polymerase-1